MATPLIAAPGISLEAPGGVPVLTGTVVAWGANDAGQSLVPDNLIGIKSIAAGASHTLAVKADGTVLAWGRSVEGQTTVPSGLADVQAVAAGTSHSLALKTDGTVVAWGYNYHGQTNVPAGLDQVKAIIAGSSHSVALKTDGTVVAWGSTTYGASQVPAGLGDLQAVSSGAYNNLGLKTDGTVVSWNYGLYGEQNVPPGLSDVRSIASGWFHSVASKSDGVVTAWGKNTYGQCTIPPEAQNVITVAAGNEHTLAIRTDRSVTAWGWNNYGQCNVPPGLRGVRSISGGSAHSVALLGPVSSMGSWASGITSPPKTYTIRNTGTSPLNISRVSVSGEDAAAFVLNTTGMLNTVPPGGQTTFTVTFTFVPGPGDFRHTQLFIDSDDPENPNYEVALTAKRGLPEISMSESPATPLSSGAVTAWGSNSYGQTTIPANALSGVVAVSSGEYHSLALKGDKTLIAWGRASDGRTLVPPSLQGRVNAIDAGSGHSLALDIDGRVTAWGINDFGQSNVPEGLTNVTSISAGTHHSLAARSDGTVVAWGNNYNGQQTVPAGLTGVKAVSAGGSHSVALKTDGTVVAWGNNNYGQRTVPGDLTGVQAIAAGDWVTLALKSDGTVVAWGNSSWGAAVPTGLSNVVAIAAGDNSAMALKQDGSVVTWGSSNSGFLKIPSGLSSVKAISVGDDYGTVITDSNVGFGNHPIGATSPPKTFAIRNDGNDVLHLSNVFLTGGDAAHFTLDTSGTSASLQPNEETTVTATFTPGANGIARTVLRILNDDPDESVHDIVLTGTVYPEIAVFDGNSTSPTDERADNSGLATFPDTAQGTSATRTFTIQNTGTTDLLGFSISVLGTHATDFQASPPASSSVAPGASTTFSVTFSPTAPFDRIATVSIASNDPDENPFEIPVTGRKTAPDIALEDSNGVLLESGRLVVWGTNEMGQTNLPPLARFGMKEIAMGNWHGMGLKNDSSLVGWGTGHNNEPTVPAGIGSVKAIAAGRSYNVAIKQDGSLYAWGSNFGNQTNVPVVTNAKAVSAGVNHGLVLKTDGTVKAWGSGYPSYAPTTLAGTDVKCIAAGYYHNISLKNNGTVVFWGSDTYPGNTYTVSGLTNVASVSAGDGYSLALKADGTVWHWMNYATPTQVAVTGAVAVSAGAAHYAVLKEDGSVLVFGSTNGNANVPAGLGSVTSIKATEYNTAAIVSGRLDFGNRAIGNRSAATTVVVRNTGNDILHISSVTIPAGNAADFLIDTTGMLSTVPAGGQTTFTVSYSPTANGLHSATLRVTSDDPDEILHDITLAGTARSEIAVFSGATTDSAAERTDNTGVEVFADAPVGTTGPTSTFTILNRNEAILTGLAVSLSGANPGDFTLTHPIATSLPQGLTTTFTVTFNPKAKGIRTATVSIASNDEDENPFEISLTGNGTVPQITVDHAGEVLDTGNVFAWGYNGDGAALVPAGLKNVQAISAGYAHSLALRNDGTVSAWGRSGFGAIAVPAGLSGVTSISAGADRNVVLKNDGTLVSWGQDSSIPLGITGVRDLACYIHKIAIKTDGTVALWGQSYYNNPPVPSGLDNVRAVAMGWGFNIALKNDGTLVYWGLPDQLAFNQMPPGLSGIRAISAGSDSVAALREDGTVLAWGENSNGQTNVPAGLTGVKMIAMGSNSCTALKYDGALVNWGYSSTSWLPVPAGFNGKGAHALSKSGGHVLALVSSNIEFGETSTGTSSVRKSITISNHGVAPLDVASIGVVGLDPNEFTLDLPGLPTSIAPGGQTSIGVRFAPAGIGGKTATLRILNNDPDKNIFNIVLNGTALTPLEAWRQTHFGASTETGERANLADFDHDGLSNLLEYAFGTHPAQNTPADDRPRCGGTPGAFTITYQRPIGGAAGITYTVELANSNISTWAAGVSGSDYSQSLFPNGDGTETVAITLTNSQAARRFVRIRVSN